MEKSWRRVGEEKLKQFQHYSEELLITRNKSNLVTIKRIAIEIKRENEVKKSQIKSFGFPAVRYGDIHSSWLFLKENLAFVNKEEIKNKKCCNNGDLLVASVSENKDDCGKSICYLGVDNALIGVDVICLTHNQNKKFLSYILNTKFCKKQKKNLCKGVTTFHFYSSDLETIKIPLPSLEEQNRIVEKLDLFYQSLEKIKNEIPKLIELNKLRIQY